MLLELRVENYAVIDSVVVEFAPGLNLLTGETGAGKSILIDALALLLGEKASTDVIRHGTEKAVVTGVFELEDPKFVGKILEENGVDFDSGEMIVRREISQAGRGRVFISNQPATVAVLKQLAPSLASLHAQRESMVSFDPHARQVLLDTFARIDVTSIGEGFYRWKKIRDRIVELERTEKDRLKLMDLWSFERNEIESAKLEANEDEQLQAEKSLLANSEKIYSSAQAGFGALYDAEDSASSRIRLGQRYVQEIARYDPKLQDALAQLESARLTVEDLGATLRDYAESMNVSPERLAEVEDRLALIEKLKRKYGGTVAEILAYGEQVSRNVSEVENSEEILRELNQQSNQAGQDYLVAARRLSQQRYQAARKLEKAVEQGIQELAMNARFQIEVSGTDELENWTAGGFDEVQYRIATNPGEPMLPLEEVASGGELSRVMLALKATVETGSPGRKKAEAAQRTLVFDEIDIGIGGRAAEAVGKKLKSLAQSQQVLCITHLPQIASFADQHFVIEKLEEGGRTRTGIRRLTEAGRREEIARMLSGAKLTEESRKHAAQLLKANG